MPDIDVDGAVGALDALIDKTSNQQAQASLQLARTVILQLQQAQMAAYKTLAADKAALTDVSDAIDRNAAQKQPYIDRVRAATRAPDGTEHDLWEYLADWCEMMSGAQEGAQ